MRFRGYKVTTPPKFLPVSLYEFKEALRLCVTDTDEDSFLSALLASATDMVEGYQRRAIVQRTLAMTLDGLSNPILPVTPPLVSVSSITYLDTAGDLQTLASTKYRVDTTSTPGRISKEYAIAYPTTHTVESAVTVNYVAGYPVYTGTFDSWTASSNQIVADFTDTIPQTGMVYVINSTGQYEAINYRSAFNNSGIWTLTVPKDSVYSYSVNDVVEVHAIPESTRLAIIAIASDMYEHPAISAEIILSENKTAKMLLSKERVPEFY